jgi:uncharacterized RDD family membrane protein YckC
MNDPTPYQPPEAALIQAGDVAEFGYAGFWKRLIAFVIDWLIIALFFAVLGLLFGGPVGAVATPAVAIQLESVAGFGGLLVPWIYHAVLESSEQQASFGKLAMNIRVTDIEGRRISFLRASVRHFGKILSSLLLLIGYIMIAFTARKQGLHDLIASCLVVNRS